jgi:hypothetical protein
MDYLKLYENICSKTYNEEYKEKHHIVPRCMGGSDDADNIIELSGKAHYLAHKLLCKMYPDSVPLARAFSMMRNGTGKKRTKINEARTYQKAKELISTQMKENNPMHDPEVAKKVSNTLRERYASGEIKATGGKSKKSRETARARMLSDDNPMKKNPEKNPFLGKSYVKGRKWYNNGEKNVYLYPDEEVPEGYVPGMVYKQRKKTN